MNEEKAKRMFAAGISTGILLLFILISVMFYQLVLIGKTRAKIKNLNQEIVALEEENDKTQDDIDIWLNEWKITERANELGYLYGEDK